MTFEETFQQYLDDSDPDHHDSMQSLFKWFYDSGTRNERQACYKVAQDALCHAGLDLATTNYIAENIKARGL
jgi:hypothetical protein